MATRSCPVEGVSKAFGAVHALYSVDFEVRPGEVMALVGDNGAGKSTLIKGIAGIYPFDEGDVYFDGQTGQDPRPARCGRRSRDRDRVPGPRSGRQSRRRRQHVPRPRAGHAVASCSTSCRWSIGPRRRSRASRSPRFSRFDRSWPALRWAAPGRRRRQGGHVGLEDGHPRRAHGRSRRGPDPAGARPGPAPGRAGVRGGHHLPQPARHLRGGRSGHGAAPGPAGRRSWTDAGATQQEVVQRSPPATWPTCPEWTRGRYERSRPTTPGPHPTRLRPTGPRAAASRTAGFDAPHASVGDYLEPSRGRGEGRRTRAAADHRRPHRDRRRLRHRSRSSS